MTLACFILASLYMGFTYNVNGNLDCSYYETYTHKNFSGILHACINGEVVHYFEYADLGMENHLQKQKD